MTVVLICHWALGGYHLIRALRALGAKTFLIYDLECASLRFSTSCLPLHRVAAIDRADPRDIADIVNGLHHRTPIDFVMGSDLESLLLIAQMRSTMLPLVYPMSTIDTLLQLHDKASFIEICRFLQIDVPNSLHVTHTIDREEIAAKIGYPLVVKPTAMFGQRGVLFIDRPQQFDLASYPYRDIIIQEFVPGQDWGASVFAREGSIVNWTTFICPDFVSAVFQENRELIEMVEKIIRYTAFTGVANFDARVDDRSGRFKMFECNPRFFLRLTAARLNGLDFVKAGIAPGVQTALTCGYYFQWRDLFTRKGVAALWNGTWTPRLLLQDLSEMVRDPLPVIGRKTFHRR